jgi:hypothetical protein
VLLCSGIALSDLASSSPPLLSQSTGYSPLSQLLFHLFIHRQTKHTLRFD